MRKQECYLLVALNINYADYTANVLDIMYSYRFLMYRMKRMDTFQHQTFMIFPVGIEIRPPDKPNPAASIFLWQLFRAVSSDIYRLIQCSYGCHAK